MQTKLTALVRSNRIKTAIAIVAIVFLLVDAWQSKSIGTWGWAMLMVYWSWPEPPAKEEKKP